MSEKGNKTNKNRKYDRNRKWCQAYRLAGTREKNKKKKLISRFKRNPEDKGCWGALEKLGVNLSSLR